jgi:hypothetical protein
VRNRTADESLLATIRIISLVGLAPRKEST